MTGKILPANRKTLTVLCRVCVAFLMMAVSSIAYTKPQVLRLLVWEGYAPEVKREAFQQYIQNKYGIEIKLEVSYIANAVDGFTAIRLKKADILSPAHNRINDKRFGMIDKGLLLPIDLSNIPNYHDLNPAFKTLDHLMHNGKFYGVPLAWGPYGLIYNSKKIKNPPDSWNVLWDPHYSDLVSVADYGELNIYITALAIGYQAKDLGVYDKLNNHKFRKKLYGLIRNSRSLWVGVDSADGLEGLTIATSWGFSLPELHRRGESWKWAYPKEGTPGWIDNHVIGYSLKDNPQLKRIAEEWINFTLCRTFQAEVLVGELAAHPVNAKSIELLSDVQKQRFYIEELDLTTKELLLMPKLDRRSRSGFDLLWEEALSKNELQ